MNPLERFTHWLERQGGIRRTTEPEYECAKCGRTVLESARDVHDEICPDWLDDEE